MIRELGAVEIGEIRSWLLAIPFTAWPQQGVGRPAMVNDLRWCGFGERTDPVVADVMRSLPGTAANRMLSVIMPGLEIERHRDPVPPGWVTRVHVPIQADDGAVFELGGTEYTLRPGIVYAVDITQWHSVRNAGSLPRIHLMWDVLAT